MADPVLSPQSGFAGLLHDHGVTPPGLFVADCHGTGMASVMALGPDPAALATRVADQFGITLPDGPQRIASGKFALIGVGRGRWLATQQAAGDAFAADLASRLIEVAAVADQADGYGLLRLSGPAVRAVLAKGVGIDLHPRSFRIGDAASTAISHIGVTMWRLPDAVDGAVVIEIALFRSMAGSFWHWLSSSAGEYGLAIVPAPAG